MKSRMTDAERRAKLAITKSIKSGIPALYTDCSTMTAEITAVTWDGKRLSVETEWGTRILTGPGFEINALVYRGPDDPAHMTDHIIWGHI